MQPGFFLVYLGVLLYFSVNPIQRSALVNISLFACEIGYKAAQKGAHAKAQVRHLHLGRG
jgi:hypothetical protein